MMVAATAGEPESGPAHAADAEGIDAPAVALHKGGKEGRVCGL